MSLFTPWPEELRLAARRLLRARGFSIVALLTLALGVGASTAIFSLLEAAVLRPLPYPRPDRLVALWSTEPGEGTELEVAPLDFMDWREQAGVFARLGGLMYWGFNLTGQGEPEAVAAAAMSPDLFLALGVPPLHGRLFHAGEETPGRDRVVVLSHGFWQRRFGGDPNIVGKPILLDGEPHEVVGVMPPRFQFPQPDLEMWTPLSLNRNAVGRRRHTLRVFGRLADGVSIARAEEAMDVVARRLAADYPETNAGRGVRLERLQELGLKRYLPALLVLQAAVAGLLVIACSNLANLLMARGLARARELGIRLALGGSRWEIARGLLAESVVLALAGGVAGLLLGLGLLRVCKALAPADYPRMQEAGLDPVVLGFAFCLSLACGILCGLVPAVRVTRLSPAQVLGEASPRAGTGRRSNRLARGLVALELAAAVLLLFCTGLLLQDFVRILATPGGFAADHRLVLQLFLPPARYPGSAERVAFFERLLADLRAVPGVEAAGAVSSLPMSATASDFALPFAIARRPASPTGVEMQAQIRIATPEYFPTLAIPLRRGRPLQATDRWDAPRVALVNETMARRFWPGGDPVGERLLLALGTPVPAEWEIVGLVGDVLHDGLAEEPKPEIYLPLAQSSSRNMAVVVKTRTDPERLLPAAKEALWQIDRDQPLYEVTTLERLVSGSVARQRFQILLVGCFALAALFLAAVGVYGVLAQLVEQQKSDLGIRLALGASAGEILRRVLRQAMSLALAGVLLGLAASAGILALAERRLPDLVPGVAHGWLPLLFAAAVLVLAGITLLGSYLPARRAQRIDPVEILRSGA